MFKEIKLFYFLYSLYYLFELVFSAGSCGKPALYKLTTFNLFNSSNNNSNSSYAFTNGTVIKYECIDKNDEIIDSTIKNRKCIDGKWTPKIPRCGKHWIEDRIFPKI
jgi:hypothetical protein